MLRPQIYQLADRRVEAWRAIASRSTLWAIAAAYIAWIRWETAKLTLSGDQAQEAERLYRGKLLAAADAMAVLKGRRERAYR